MFSFLLCSLLKEKNYFADFIDPASGLPCESDGNSIYNEVQSAMILLQYRIMNVGCCKVLLHPQWNSVSFFTFSFNNSLLIFHFL